MTFSNLKHNTEPKILVSACLLGKLVRYDGKHCLIQNEGLNKLIKQGRAVSICPEMAGGLSTPRNRATIHGDGGGHAVLAEKANIITYKKENVTNEYLIGAKKTLALAQDNNIKVAILKEDSPSCGSHNIYNNDATLKIPGSGLTTALLEKNGIKVFSENEIDMAIKEVEKLASTKE